MEHITAIQEAIDEHRDAVPTEVARQVLVATQKLYDDLDKPKLYRVKLTHVHAVSFVEDCSIDPIPVTVKLYDFTQVLLVEAVHDPTLNYMPKLNMGLMYDGWLAAHMPKIVNLGEDVLIVHSIVPFTPTRSRE